MLFEDDGVSDPVPEFGDSVLASEGLDSVVVP